MPAAVARAYHLAFAALAAAAAVHDVETHRLDNGLTVHVAAGHPSPVVALQAWVGTGSADEAPAVAGVAHVLEHMLFKGSSAFGVGELSRAIERAGGEINAWTAFDHTVYHAVLARDHADVAIDALGDALTAPRVEPHELERERRVILEEIRQGGDDPARSVAQSLFAAAYVAHPYRRPVIGTADSVQRLGERELVEFFRSYYVADNVTLVVAGDVDPARIVRGIEKRFRAMPSGRPARRAVDEPMQASPRAVAAARDVSEAYVAVGFHVPAARHPDLAALDVAAILLGETESARFVRRLRDRDELVTGASAHVHALRDPGLFVLSATAPVRTAERAVGALVAEALALVDELPDDELIKARVAAEAGLVRQLETAQGRARAIGWNASVAGDPQFAHVYLDRIRAVRRHDVAAAVRRYLRADNATVSAILPARAGKQRAAFARQVERRVRSAATHAAPAPAVVDKRVVLGNGMVLLVRRDPSVPIVAMRAVWRGGQLAEDDARAGASTLLARTITRGCGKLDAAAVADRIDRLGGSLGGVAGRNSFGLAAEWLSRSWQTGFDLFADCVLDPALSRDEIAREKKLLLADQTAQRDNPTQVVFRLFNDALYGDHPYHRDVLGTPASISSLDSADLSAFYRAQYPISGLTLAIVGDIDIDDAIARATTRFSRSPSVRSPKSEVRSPVFSARSPESREVYRYLDRAQAHLVLGFPGATVDASDRFALEVLVTVLGGQGGRLFGELRDKQGLVYRVSAHSVEGVAPGFVAVYLACAPDKLEAALAAVRGELARVRDGGITADELERAKSYLVGSHQIAMQRRSAIANAMAYHEAYGLGWASWARYDDAIAAVTAADVAAAARAYLRDDLAITATVRPPAATPAAKKKSKLPPAAAPVRAKPKARANA
ncbi:MAG TPA: pitrilysin family protein [Kofleriaceae bacterium]